MKIIILGAGEFGKNLASTLCSNNHDVVVVDRKANTLDDINENLDVMVIRGNGATIDALKKAGIEQAELLLAVSGNEESNILACQIADHFGAKMKICRLYSKEFFSEKDGFLPHKLGITHTVIPEEDCVTNIMNVLDKQITLEKIFFSNQNASMTAFQVLHNSQITGIRLKDFPERELVNKVRFAAIIRDGKLLTPNGDTILLASDEVYLAGSNDNVQAMLDWISPKEPDLKTVVIAGATRIGASLAINLLNLGFTVKMIENDKRRCDDFLDSCKENIMILKGLSTNKSILNIAGVHSCDIFVSTVDDDEENILSCVLAKKMGAKKVITVTHKHEYVEIVPDMRMIDAGFNTGLVAVNTVLRHLGTGTGKLSIDAVLHRFNAYIFEYTVRKGSKLCDKKIRDCNFPSMAVLALIFRKGEVITPDGNLTIQEDDIIATIATTENARILGPIFEKRSFL